MDRCNSKHKILLFTSGYKYSGSANGVCTRNLVREFVRQGHDVYVIAVPHDNESEMEELDGAKVWFVQDELQTRILGYLQQHRVNALMRCLHKVYALIRALLIAPFYPNAARLRVRNVLKISRSIIKAYAIDTVIGTCLPYDGIPAAISLKKEYGERLRVVTYHFDILSTPNNNSGIMYSFKAKRFAKAFDKERMIVDKVFLPETAKEIHADKENIKYIGLPVYLTEEPIETTYSFHYSSDVYNIAYIGSLDIRNRSIQPAIDLIRSLNAKSKKKYLLHIWGALADADTRILIEQSKDIALYHGMLDNGKVKTVMMHADFLLNISNKLLYKLLPSKIFTMFSTGRPIINIVNNTMDCSLPYFERYGNVLNISANEIGTIQIEPTGIIGAEVNANALFVDYMPSTITKILLSDD